MEQNTLFRFEPAFTTPIRPQRHQSRYSGDPVFQGLLLFIIAITCIYLLAARYSEKSQAMNVSGLRPLADSRMDYQEHSIPDRATSSVVVVGALAKAYSAKRPKKR